MLLKEIKSIFHKELNDRYPTEEIDSFFHLLIEHYLGLARFVLAMQPRLTLTKDEEQPLFEALTALRKHRPIQYIIGSAHFMDMDFKVNENVLIPRPETEELVRWVIEDIKGTGTRIQLPEVQPAVRGARVRDSHERHGLPNQRADLPDESPNKLDFHILDIGTGSGCIAVSLAKNLPGVKVHALDVSVGALNVARKNAHLNQVNISFLKADILDVPDSEVRYDIMVSNPPYVRESERKDMQKNVTDHEPESALFVSDENPLKFYDAIARFAQRNLKEHGRLYLEINQFLALEIEQLLKHHGFPKIERRTDMFGNHRMIAASLKTVS